MANWSSLEVKINAQIKRAYSVSRHFNFKQRQEFADWYADQQKILKLSRIGESFSPGESKIHELALRNLLNPKQGKFDNFEWNHDDF